MRDVDVALPEAPPQLVLVARPETVLGEGIDELHAPPGGGEVDLLALERHLRRAEYVLRRPRDELLDPFHRVAVVGVCLVPLEHRELGVVLERDALVAEVLADLVHLLEPADDQPLEVQLGGDAQVAILVERVVVRHERLCESSAVARLQHGRLDLDEPPLVEDSPDRRDRPRPDQGVAARLLVHQQVEVALPVAELDVGQPVEGVGQRRVASREDLERVDLERRLAAARLRRRARDADDVTQVDLDLARALHRAQELDAPAPVDEVEKDELAHVAAGHHAPREPARRLSGRAVLERFRFDSDRRAVVAVGEALRRGHGGRV